MSVSRRVAVLATLFSSVACIRSLPDIPSNANGVTVSGRLVEREAASGLFVPVRGARVAIAGSGVGARSDEDGRFEIAALPLGALRLVVLAARPQRDPAVLKVIGGVFGRVDGERVALGEIEVLDPGTLHGDVTIASAPDPSLAEGTLVAVAETAFRAIVDERGAYALPRLPEGGTFDVVAFRAGYRPARHRGVTVLANASIELAPLVLEGAGPDTSRDVRGTARLAAVGDAPTGHGGITVACTAETSTPAPALSATTGDDGSFALTLAYGMYRCEASATGARTVRVPGVAVLPEGVVGLPPLWLTAIGDPATADLDLDGTPDARDDDRDGDGVPNAADVAPDDPDVALDTDSDGVGDALDLDDDADALSDAEEIRRGRDGVLTDPLRADSDDDGARDDRDVCPAVPDPPQLDSDGDGLGDACDTPDTEEPPVEVPLAVTGFAPARAGVGLSITIRGRGFDRAARSNVVTFGGDVLAQASAVTADRLTVTVPPGALTGPIAVYNGRTVETSTGTLTILPAPLVTSFAPTAATVAQEVLLTGRGLAGARVLVGTAEAVVTSSADDRLAFLVPALVAGEWPLEVRTDGGVVRAGLPLLVLGDLRVNTLIPQIAGRGQLLRVLGSGLIGRAEETVEVSFTGAAAPAAPTYATIDELRVVIPDDAQTGPITVRRGAARVTSGFALTIDGNLATIRSIDPWIVQPGETVRLSGDNFQRVTAVRLAGALVPHTVDSDTTITLTVPAVGARAGAITIESTDAAMRTVTSTAPEGLNLFKLVRRRSYVRSPLFAVIDPTRDSAYAAYGGVNLGVTIDLRSLAATGTTSVPSVSLTVVAVAPDGRSVGVSSASGLGVLDFRTWVVASCTADPGVAVGAFSPDGSRLFARGNRLYTIDLTQPLPATCPVIAGSTFGYGLLHTDASRRLLIDDDSGGMQVLDADASSPTFGQAVGAPWPTNAPVPIWWAPPVPGRPSGEIPGGGVWAGQGGTISVLLMPFTNAASRPMASPRVYQRITQTPDRRWAIGPNFGGSSLTVMDLVNGRGRTLDIEDGVLVTAVGGRVPRALVWHVADRIVSLFEIDVADQ